MLEALDAVPWASLGHNYGPAEDVPMLLRALLGGSVSSAAACGNLDNALYHQGGWVCDAATAALPFLLEVVSSARCLVRPGVLGLVAALAQAAGEAAPENIDAGWSAAWQQAVPGLEGLVSDPDPAIRAAAIVALTSGPPRPSTGPVLVQQLRDEREASVRLDLLLGLGATLSRSEDPAVREALERTLSEPTPQDRFAAVLALAITDPRLPLAEQPVVLDALTAPDVHLWDATETLGSVAAVFTRASELYQDHPAQRQALATALHYRNAAQGRRRAVLVPLLPTFALCATRRVKIRRWCA